MTDSTVAGDWEPGAMIIMMRNNGAAKVKGDVQVIDTATTPDSLKVSPTAGVRPFYICTKPAAATQGWVTVAIAGTVYLTAGATIEVGQYVMPDATVPGRIKVWDAVAETTKIGRYLGHLDEGDGKSLPTALLVGEIGRVRLGV